LKIKKPVVESVEETEMANEIEQVKSIIDDLGLNDLKEIVVYSQSRLDEIQNEEASDLEKQIQELQSKLSAIKGSSGSHLPRRNIIPVVNPDDSSQIYLTGPRPSWLKELLKDAKGDKVKEKEIIANLRSQ
jgi:hypothetical protein